MTQLSKVVKRSARTPRGEYVVILHPGAEPLIEVREKCRRAGFQVGVGNLYTLLALRQADLQVAKRRRGRI